jgi:hypothetical protein
MRIRNAFWILAMLAVPALVLAQQPPQSTPAKAPAKEKPAAEAQKPAEQAAPAQAPAPTFSSVAPKKPVSTYPPAPKPGHPLDPADVDVLTGKSKAPSTYGPYGYRLMVDPYSGFGYPSGSTGLNDPVFSSPSLSNFSGVPPFAFGQFGGRRFVFVNGAQAGLPFLFFNRGSDRAFVFLGRGLSVF